MPAYPLRQRGRVWYCTLPTPSGRGRRKEVSTRCYDYQAAIERWREWERALVRCPDRSQDTTPLREALDARLRERESAGRSAGYLSMLRVKGRQLMRVLGKDTPLEHITAEAVDGYVSQRLKEKRKRSTIHKELVTLRGALRLAKRYGKYHKDLAEVMPQISGTSKPRTRRLSEKEIGKLLKQLVPKRRCVVAFLLATGATYPSELERLERRDVDMRRWMVHLPGTKRETRDRYVPVVAFARPWLRMAMAGWPFEPWSNVRRDLKQACERAKMAPCSPNDLRRSVASLMRARGVEPSLIGAFLGHADSRMAERVYGKLAPEELAHLLAQRLDRFRRRSA